MWYLSCPRLVCLSLSNWNIISSFLFFMLWSLKISGSRAEKWKEQPRMGNLCCNQRATFNCWPKPRTSLRWTLHKLTNTSTFPRTWARRVFIFCTKSLKQWSVSLRLTRKPIWNLRLFILGVMERYFGWSFVCLFIYFWHSRGHIF